MSAPATLAQLVRFGLVGIAATAVHYLVALTTAQAITPYVANLLGYLAAVGVSYFGHRHITFRKTGEGDAHRRQLPRFVITSLSGLLLSELVLLAALALGLDKPLSLALAALAVPPYSYLLSRFWVFR